MKCTNKVFHLGIILWTCFAISGCGKQDIAMEYNRDTQISGYQFDTFSDENYADAFAQNICVVEKDTNTASADTSQAEAALLCDVNKGDVLYAKGVYTQLHPASLTKVMTALVALKHGNLEDEMTASANVEIQESGASLVGIKAGDKMTLSQALYCLLMPSGNDAAVMIAEHIGGSVEGFAKMMNEEAASLGATGSHFMNPHGLTEDNHYITAYDMYLIFNEAIQYDVFNEIINTSTYSTVYHDASGNPKEISFDTTNLYLKQDVTAPANVTVIGGKTGTTNAAQNCLVLLSKDTGGNPYISIILKCSERGILYEEMTNLLENIK